MKLGLPGYISQAPYQSVVGIHMLFQCILSSSSVPTFGVEFITMHRFPLTYNSLSLFLPRMYEIEPPVFLLVPLPFVSIAPPMLMACTGRNAVVICQSPAGKFASFDVRGCGWGGEWCEYERKRVGGDGTYP